MRSPKISIPPGATVRASPPPGPGRSSAWWERLRPKWLIIATLVLAAAGSYYGYRQARVAAINLQVSLTSDFQSAQSALERGKTLVKKANSEHRVADLDQADTLFHASGNQFRDAGARVDTNPWIRLVEIIPLVGSSIRQKHVTASEISRMGIAISQAAIEGVQIDRALLSPVASGQGEPRILAALQMIGPGLPAIESELRTADAAATTADPRALSGRQRELLLSARNRIHAELLGVQQLRDLLPTLVDLVGGNGPRTYLIEQVNPSELRSGGGFIGTVSVMHADHGSFSLSFSGDVTLFDTRRPSAGEPGYVAPPAPLDTFSDFFLGKSWYFADSNFFPDFQENAKWAAYFAGQMRALHPDGVIALDYNAVASLLAVTGPISMPSYGVSVDSQNFVQLVVQLDLNGDPRRKALVAAVAEVLVKKLSTLPPDRLVQMAASLNRSAADRHLQVSFTSKVTEGAFQRAGWYQNLNPVRRNGFIMETEDNLGGDKANYFVTRRYIVTLTRKGTTIHHKVVVQIRDQAPASARLRSGGVYYSAYLRFYTTALASNLRLTGDLVGPGQFAPVSDALQKDVPTGFVVKDARFVLQIEPGESARLDVTFEFDQAWGTDSLGHHILYWQKQPGTMNDAVDITWIDGGHTFRASGDLGQDQSIELSPSGLSLTPVQTTSVPQLGF